MEHEEPRTDKLPLNDAPVPLLQQEAQKLVESVRSLARGRIPARHLLGALGVRGEGGRSGGSERPPVDLFFIGNRIDSEGTREGRE